MEQNLIKSEVESRIFTIRGMQVMLDKDLAELYGVNTMRLNEQVRRNTERFPESFCFQLTKEEMTMWISQFAISKSTKRGFRKQPLVFTEYGVAMVSAVLRSQIAIETSIHIVKAFIEYRKGKIHDRFLILDEKELYHLGASLKDLGKRWFAFSKLDGLVSDVLNHLR